MLESSVAICKKCGATHDVERYRTLTYYFCPEVNRVLLLSDDALGDKIHVQDRLDDTEESR